MSTKVEAPPPRDLYKEGSDTLSAQINLAPQQFGAESQFAPQYAQLYQNIFGRSLLGPGADTSSLLGIYGQATPQLGQIQANANTQQRLADIGDVESFGGRAVSAFNNANPELAQIRQQMLAQARDASGSIGSISAPQFQAVENNWQASPFERIAAGQNTAATALQDRAVSDLALGGQLGAGESRGITNDVLARFNRSGRANDPAAIAGVALGLDQAQNSRLMQRQNAAAQAGGLMQGVNALGLDASRSNQAAGLQQQGMGLQASLANQQYANQAGLANQQMSYQTQFANQQAGLQNQQLNLQRLMQAAGFLQNSQVDPFQAILGRSGSPAMAMGAYGQGQSSGGATGMFNPFTDYGSDLYNTNYNAQAGANIASGNNKAAIIGGGLGALGSIFGGMFG